MTDPTVEATADGITITRVFDAPREAVFRAWIEPASFADWFGGRDAEVPLDTVSMDVRPGGEWRATMLAGETGTIPWHGVYREVVEPERLVFTVSDRPGEEFELVTVDLADLGDGRTEMRFRQTGGHLDAKGYGEAAQGWTGFFARMDELLAAA
jgi:uncharacterized protein YndB with AHSA1/START domain